MAWPRSARSTRWGKAAPPRECDAIDRLLLMSAAVSDVAPATSSPFESLSRSDRLASYRRIIERLPALKALFGELVYFRVVIDAERVQGTLRWLLGKRINPHARTGLEEAIVSGTLVAIAPKEIEAEIEKYLPTIAEECGVTVDYAEQEWGRLKQLICIVEVTTRTDPDAVDPKDLPYETALTQFAAAAVYSKDPHFPRMGVPVICVDIDIFLRDYARASSFTTGLKLGSTFSLIIGLEGFLALARFGKGIVGAFDRLPAWMKGVIVLGIAGLLIHPKSRAYILERIAQCSALLKEAAIPIGSALLDALEAFEKAQAAAKTAHGEIRARLPIPRPGTALAHARAVCVMSAEPISLATIEYRMRADGYKSRSKDLARYLKRLMRHSADFVEVSPGNWIFVKAPTLSATAE